LVTHGRLAPLRMKMAVDRSLVATSALPWCQERENSSDLRLPAPRAVAASVLLGRLNRVKAALTRSTRAARLRRVAIRHCRALTRVCCCDLTTHPMLGRDHEQDEPNHQSGW
jgi:hypothetical protein